MCTRENGYRSDCAAVTKKNPTLDDLGMLVSNNSIVTPSGKVTVCGMPLEKYQSKYNRDTLSSAHAMPPVSDLVAMAQRLIWT